jgi:hypothetical protein
MPLISRSAGQTHEKARVVAGPLMIRVDGSGSCRRLSRADATKI